MFENFAQNFLNQPSAENVNKFSKQIYSREKQIQPVESKIVEIKRITFLK